jgi:hypothetical protein
MSKGVLAEGEELGSNILHPEMLASGGRPAPRDRTYDLQVMSGFKATAGGEAGSAPFSVGRVGNSC